MMMRRIFFTALVSCTLLGACSSTDSSAPAPGADMGIPDATPDAVSDASLDSGDASPLGPVYTHKMLQRTGENPYAALAYECPQCSFAQYLAIEVPEGWFKGPTQVLLPAGELRSKPSLEGVAPAVDFLPEVPGEEYELIAKTLDAEIVERVGGRTVAEAQVLRDTVFRYAAGTRVHEVTDGEGRVFVLFAWGVDPVNPAPPDFQEPDALGDFQAPGGWTYASRVLTEVLVMDVSDVATVLAFRGEVDSTWQKR